MRNLCGFEMHFWQTQIHVNPIGKNIPKRHNMLETASQLCFLQLCVDHPFALQVVVGQQKDSTTKDIILKVAASKEAPVRAAFGSSAQCEIVEVCSGSDAPFQICNFFLDDTSEVVGVHKVSLYDLSLGLLHSSFH